MRPEVAISEVAAEAFEIPTNQPEGDGTLTWSSTVMVVVRARAGDAEGLVLARRVVGDDVELYVDANGAYRAKQAIRLGQRMSEARR
ncbi:MAG TPA: hypothetical protein VGL60_08275 [Acidimicrobiales bacterium]